jgi:ankyrin repeat protein
MIGSGLFLPMRLFKIQAVFGSAIAALVVLGITNLGPEPRVCSPISTDEFVRALATHRTSLIDLYLSEGLNPNARAGQDRPLILAAALQQDWKTVQRLLKAGASVDLADERGLTPLMAAAIHGNIETISALMPLATNVAATDLNGRSALHYAVAAEKTEAMELLLPIISGLGKPCADGRNLLAIALDTGNERIIEAFLYRFPPLQEWTSGTRRALEAALLAGNKDQVRLLLTKHAAPPTLEGRSVPLLAYAIASHNEALFNMLIDCGADPNTVLPPRCDNDFLALLPSRLKNCIDGDKGVTSLMLAAGLGQADYLRALLAAGADRDRATTRYKMLPLYLAAETGKWQCTQILLGSGPPPDQLRIEISLASQHVALIKDGVSVFNTTCSTGREGYSTRAGDYVITDKDRNHWSTIYKVEMPYFMRLSCLDFGMHEGVVPNYPASHGCIRLPGDAARKLFAEIPIGTLVTVK